MYNISTLRYQISFFGPVASCTASFVVRPWRACALCVPFSKFIALANEICGTGWSEPRRHPCRYRKASSQIRRDTPILFSSVCSFAWFLHLTHLQTYVLLLCTHAENCIPSNNTAKWCECVLCCFCFNDFAIFLCDIHFRVHWRVN